MKQAQFSAETKLWRLPHLNDLELLHGQHLTHAFPRHTHERYCIGMIEDGVLGYEYRGENVTALRGNLNLCIPGEPHTGRPLVDEGWSYRMFYFDAAFLQTVAAEMADRPRQLPYFAAGAINDAELARQVRQLHIALTQETTSILAQETALIEMLSRLITRHADDPPSVHAVGREPDAVRQVKQYLERHYAEDVSLTALSQLTHLSRYHLVRVFRDTVGVPPHAYLRQVRIKHAKQLLKQGVSLADAALTTGFTDQSHLARWFKRLWGVTPGQYRNSVQDPFR